MKINNIIIPALVTILALFLAFLANLYIPSFTWDLFDFIVIGIMIFIASLLITITMTRIKNNKYRILISFVILLLLLYVWAELAVGIFFNFGS